MGWPVYRKPRTPHEAGPAQKAEALRACIIRTRQSRRAMGKGGIVFYFWEADACENGSLGPNTVVNSNQKNPGFGSLGG